jgi:hypothetical protein
MRPVFLHAGLFALSIALAACGGGGAASATAGPATAAPAASDIGGGQASTTQPETPTEAPAASTAASGGGSGGSGGSAATACNLITTDELGATLPASGVTAEPMTGEPSYCTYSAGGATVAATSFASANAEGTFGVFAAEDGAVQVPLGDKAVFSPSTNTLFVLKGGKVFGLTLAGLDLEQDARIELMRKLAVFAAGRM